MMNFKSTYEIEAYSPLLILNRISENDLIIEDFKEVKPYAFQFKARKSLQKKLFKLFPSIKVVKDPFLIHVIISLVKKKTGLIAMLIALSCFYFLSTRIYDLKIEGNDKYLENEIRLILEDKGIKPFAIIPRDEVIVSLNNNMMNEMGDELERFEITKVGGTISVKYEKKRPPVILPSLEKNLYASKDGVITRIEVTHGDVLVKVGDFVSKGSLLVSGSFIEGQEKEEVFGKIYASTWYDIEVEVNNVDEATNYSNLLSLGDELILQKDRKLLDRIILEYKCNENKAKMKLHYTIEENIAIS